MSCSALAMSPSWSPLTHHGWASPASHYVRLVVYLLRRHPGGRLLPCQLLAGSSCALQRLGCDAEALEVSRWLCTCFSGIRLCIYPEALLPRAACHPRGWSSEGSPCLLPSWRVSVKVVGQIVSGFGHACGHATQAKIFFLVCPASPSWSKISLIVGEIGGMHVVKSSPQMVCYSLCILRMSATHLRVHLSDAGTPNESTYL
jgi:hypothetical protein